MPLKVLNNDAAWDAKQNEDKHFSKICFIPSLGLSCFGILVLLPGRYLLGFGALAAAVAVAKTSPSQVVWMRKV